MQWVHFQTLHKVIQIQEDPVELTKHLDNNYARRHLGPPFTNMVKNYIHHNMQDDIAYPFLEDTWGPLFLTWLSNYIHHNMQDDIAYPFLNVNGATIDV